MGKMSFDKWLKQVDLEMNKLGHQGSYVAETGRECWLGFYEDGYTPAKAVAEDMSNADG